MRPRNCEAERRERERQQHGRDEPEPRRLPEDAGEHLHVREADGVLHAPPRRAPPAEPRERQHEQRQQQERALEAHPPPAQRRSSWTTARIRAAARLASDRRRDAPAVRLPLNVHRAGSCQRGRPLRAKRDRVARSDETLARSAGGCDVAGRVGGHAERGGPQHRRVCGRIDLVDDGRHALSAAQAGDAADVRAKARRRIPAGHEPAEEDSRPRRADPRIDRAPQRRAEHDVERTGRQLGVGASDDEALRTGELPLRLSPSGRQYPGPGHRHALREAVALARRTGRTGGRKSGGGRDRREQEQPPHGTNRRNQRNERPEPTRRSSAPPPAKTSVICLSSVV